MDIQERMLQYVRAHETDTASEVMDVVTTPARSQPAQCLHIDVRAVSIRIFALIVFSVQSAVI